MNATSCGPGELSRIRGMSVTFSNIIIALFSYACTATGLHKKVDDVRVSSYMLYIYITNNILKEKTFYLV